MNLISMTLNFEMHPDFTQNINIAPKAGRALMFSNVLGRAMFTLGVMICSTPRGMSPEKIVGGSCNDMILYGIVFYG